MAKLDLVLSLCAYIYIYIFIFNTFCETNVSGSGNDFTLDRIVDNRAQL